MGVTPDCCLVSKILKISPPNDKKELQPFIGLVKFYGRHIKIYAKIFSKNNLRMKGLKFKWRNINTHFNR